MTCTLVINFGEDLIKDPSTKYWVFFSSLPSISNTYGHTNAILVKDIHSKEITGFLEGDSSKSFIFDYANNTQGRREPNTPIEVVVVAISLKNSLYTKATGVLLKGFTTTIPLLNF